jgi:hypothetical protein
MNADLPIFADQFSVHPPNPRSSAAYSWLPLARPGLKMNNQLQA